MPLSRRNDCNHQVNLGVAIEVLKGNLTLMVTSNNLRARESNEKEQMLLFLTSWISNRMHWTVLLQDPCPKTILEKNGS
jgi:hypothetical protein